MGLIIGFAASLVILKFGYPLVVRVVAFLMDMLRLATGGRVLSGRTSAWSAVIVHHSVYGALVGLAVAMTWSHANGPQHAIISALGAMSLLVDLIDHRQDLIVRAARDAHDGPSDEVATHCAHLLEATPHAMIGAFLAALAAVVAPGLVLEGPVIRILAIGFTGVLNFFQSIPLLKGLLGIVALIHIANAVFMTAAAARGMMISQTPRRDAGAPAPPTREPIREVDPDDALNRYEAFRVAVRWALWRFASPDESAVDHATSVFMKATHRANVRQWVARTLAKEPEMLLPRRQPRNRDREEVGRAAAKVLANGTFGDDELYFAMRELAAWTNSTVGTTRAWIEEHLETAHPSDG